MRIKSLCLALFALSLALLSRTASAAIPVVHVPPSVSDLATEIQTLTHTTYPGGVVVVLTNGTYNMTPGVDIVAANYPHFELIGAGTNTTIIRYKNNSIASHTAGTQHAAFRGSYVSNFFARDFTIDCNWANQSSSYIGSGYTSGFRLAGITMKCWVADILRVEVKNAGANGYGTDPCTDGGPGGMGMEVFPISISTLNNNVSFIEIKQCIVRDVYTVNGGYCTGIIVGTHLYDAMGNYSTDASQTIAMGARTTLAAEIHDNMVVNVPGIAYGCARSEMVDFFANYCNGATVAFNADTGMNSKIWIQNNTFENIYTGISIGSACHSTKYFTNYVVTENRFSFTGVGSTPSYCLQFQGSVADVEADDNVIVSGTPDYEYLVPSGCHCDKFYARFIDYPSLDLNDTGWNLTVLYDVSEQEECEDSGCD